MLMPGFIWVQTTVEAMADGESRSIGFMILTWKTSKHVKSSPASELLKGRFETALPAYHQSLAPLLDDTLVDSYGLFSRTNIVAILQGISYIRLGLLRIVTCPGPQRVNGISSAFPFLSLSLLFIHQSNQWTVGHSSEGSAYPCRRHELNW